ncbi:neutral/alkaline non-lysosomal ceramidase N-terminal domain-containing protein [Tautonia plasticadhaerens]|uniref:Neutral ceramidase n=1 Tax=Tautonia plasticadhaerens TaxID=2527974 RepID=A0A518H4L8_9BACT|nr:neutral/alkaline non-lysosomal ceramidase N-terminal domain-containing protein [Tautonia plasticadhaerens]QDV35778.1 Neutral ceramidase precursor [Tautonia plasticadhaerens]
MVGLRGAIILAWLAGAASGAEGLRVGFGRADITPGVGEGSKPVYLAGFGQGREATGVHDPLWSRAVVLEDGEHRIALVSVDLIGLQHEVTLAARERLEGFSYVLVASTHNHEGPDVIGLWGPGPTTSGVDPEYVKRVGDGIVASVREAEASLSPAIAEYGTAEDASLLADSRTPVVKDGVLRVLRFSPPGGGEPIGLLVQWNCHPENLGSHNTLVTADFPYATVAALEARHGCPVAYFSGAIGGLMSAAEDVLKTPDGASYREGEFAFAEAYGEAVADLADEAIGGAGPIALTPFAVSTVDVALPLENTLYRVARAAGVLDRLGYRWTGDPFSPGKALGRRNIFGPLAVLTEVAYLRLGALHVAGIPGELYPELVSGEVEDPADPNADFPDAAVEPSVLGLLPEGQGLILGLANDEVGYIIPRRQWDRVAPFAYGRDRAQYGEINSVGPQAAPILMEALGRAIQGVPDGRGPDSCSGSDREGADRTTPARIDPGEARPPCP